MSLPVILCVDDEKIILDSIKSALKKTVVNGFAIEIAESGEEALELLRELMEEGVEVPLVISDQLMPHMKGDRLLSYIHQLSPDTLSILLTGDANADAIGNALNNANLYRYIPKPWDERDFSITVKQALKTYFQEKKVLQQGIELEKMVEELQTVNANLEKKVEERVKEINDKNLKIASQNKELIRNFKVNESIRYAQTIQHAILPYQKKLKSTLKDYFIIYKPKELVSGDFYWFAKVDGKILLATVDCTGHGVPGAFMSMIGSIQLNEIVVGKSIHDPAMVLEILNKKIKKALNQEENGDQVNGDGMDLSLCLLEQAELENKVKLTFAGAKSRLYYFNKLENKVIRLKGDSKSIGGRKNNGSFRNHTLMLDVGDTIYLATDGVIDQNAPNGKRFGTARFMEMLNNIVDLPMNEQKHFIEYELDKFKHNMDQRDDITIWGINF